ncbi:hypothetical protein ACN4EE_16245 [Geminocystis sp. CENA526]|uniref:hypothetical protein n=1 Tax=Geminocystis sp. CENA526 TaxID=1355871 RepID=UPI003D6FDD1C
MSDREINRLHELMIYGRWLAVVIAWIVIMPFALWDMRETIVLCMEYCTWSGIRLGLEFHPFSALGLSFCIGFAVSVLVWQSKIILQGDLSDKQKYYLARQVEKIRQQGNSHWLYNWVFDRK